MQLSQLIDAPKRELARAMALLEADGGVLSHAGLLDDAVRARRAHVVGITGPPGVGKSTAINLLVQLIRRRDQRVAVVAIDPSSKRTGGAILGDRNRFDLDPEDENIWVRSLAARSQLGGLAEGAIGAVALLAALFDIVIVETVGVGQSETDISDLADSVVVAVQPSSGDSLQFMKAGIMEIPDILVVTKADLGAAAERTARDMAIASKAQTTTSRVEAEVLKIAANLSLHESGVPELLDAIDRHMQRLHACGSLDERRRQQAVHWQERLATAWFGRAGLDVARPHLQSERPFSSLASLHQRLTAAFAYVASANG